MNELGIDLNILAIDTALSGCAVTFYCGKTRQYVTLSEDMKRGQAERLVPLIEEVIVESNMSYADIGAIAVTNGPGAFTGLRVGLSTARALALALNVPVLGVSTIDVIYAQYEKGASERSQFCENLIVVLETKRDDFYVGAWRNGELALPAQALDGKSIYDYVECDNNAIIIGDAAKRFMDEHADKMASWQWTDGYQNISTEMLVDLACAYFTACPVNGYRPINVSPAYLKPADVSKSKKTYKSINSKTSS